MMRPELCFSNAKPSRAGLWWYRERNHPAGRGLCLAFITEDLIFARVIVINEEFEFRGETEELISRMNGQWAGPETAPIYTVVDDVDEIEGPSAVDAPLK